MRPETETAYAPLRTAGSPARIPLSLWLAVLLGLAAAAGFGYLGARWTAESMRAELALRPPVILFDMAGAVRDAGPVQLGAVLARGKEQAQRLAAGGFLVFDVQAVIAAPPERYLAPSGSPDNGVMSPDQIRFTRDTLWHRQSHDSEGKTMPSTPISQPTATTIAVDDLVAETLKGRLRIPEFQRPLRWQWRDVCRLFDSIVKGYPIGSLLLWIRPAPEASVRLGGLRIDARRFDDAWWVVDGQQRLTSLANALSDLGAHDERFALAYDLQRETIGHLGKADEGHIIPLPVLFDLQRLIRWFTKDHPEAADGLDEASRITKAIRDYKVPAYLVGQEDEQVLRDIFDRMNNYGKRLSRAEVFSALHPGEVRGMEPASACQRISEAIHAERGFGLVDDKTVLSCVLARRGGNVSRDIRVEFSESTREARDFGSEMAETAYRGGELALLRAVAFLQEDAGVPHFAFLPYRYLLVVLTRFFALFPNPEQRNRVLLRRWVWRAAMVGPGPFASSWTNAMRTLATRIVAGNENGSVQGLLDEPIDHGVRSPPLTGFRTNSAASRIVLSALWALEPRSLVTGQPYERADLVEPILPRGTLAEVAQPVLRGKPNAQTAWAANRILVLDPDLPGTPSDLLVAPPLERQCDQQAFLASHAMDDDMISALSRDDKIGFLEARQRRLEEVVRSFLEAMVESHLEDTPPLSSFDLDDRLVGHLHRRDDLTRFVFTSDYWNDPNRPVLGLRFEENPREHHRANMRLPPWFSNLLPEGRLRDWIADAGKISVKREMELLAQVGHDLPGAVRVLPSEQLVSVDLSGDDAGRFPPSAVQAGLWSFSLAGVGLKFSMLAQGDRLVVPGVGEGGDWILKMPDPSYPSVPHNELAMMTLAAAVGIEVPEVRLLHRDQFAVIPDRVWSKEEYAYAVRRFDRGSGRAAIHIEDMAQVRGVYPDGEGNSPGKYSGSFETIGALVYRGHDTSALREFARRLAFNVLIGNGDAHLKNWSLIYRDPRIPTLAPAYDLVATFVYRPPELGPENMGLRFGRSRRFEDVRLAKFDALDKKLTAKAELADVARALVGRVLDEWPKAATILADRNDLCSQIQCHVSEQAAQLLG